MTRYHALVFIVGVLLGIIAAAVAGIVYLVRNWRLW